MTNKLLAAAAMIAVTALTTIRYNGERHVPGSPSADFDADKKTADSLVASGAAAYADAELAKQPGPEGGGEGGGTGEDSATGNLSVKIDVPNPDGVKAALDAVAASKVATDTKPATTTVTVEKATAKKAPSAPAKAAAKKK